MFTVNGIDVGEIGMEALIAGQYGVPLLLVTGDLAAKKEALALSPDTRCAVVKESSGYRNTAVCYPACETQEEIYRQARDAVKHASEIAPVTLQAPYTLRFTFRGQVPVSYTHLAQVNGRDLVDEESKVNLDTEYLMHISFFLDLKILLKTVAVVFSRKDYQEGCVENADAVTANKPEDANAA